MAEKLFFLQSEKRRNSEKKSIESILSASAVMMMTAIVFNLFMMTRSFRTDGVTRFPVIVVVGFSIYVVAAYISALVGAHKARRSGLLAEFAAKLTGIAGALVNCVLLQRLILAHINLAPELIITINSVFGYFIGGILFIMAIIMFYMCFSAKRKLLSRKETA